MKNRLILTLTLIVAFSLAAVPASAKQGISVDWTAGATTPGSCDNVTWIGELDIGDELYAFVLRSTETPGEFRGNSYHYEETIEIYGQPYDLVSCKPGSELLLEGITEGSSSLANAKFRANGVVRYVAPDGPFASLDGRRIHDRGVVTTVDLPGVGPVPVSFHGTFRIN